MIASTGYVLRSYGMHDAMDILYEFMMDGDSLLEKKHVNV